MITIEVNIHAADLARALQGLMDAGQNTTPLMQELAGIMHDSVEDAFAAERDPVTGTPWPRLTAAYARQRAEAGHAGKLLQLSGGLAASITRQYGNGYARVGTNKAYAAMHQFGGITRAHVIRARFKKALRLPGIGCRKKVMHPGSEIPRRRFMGIGPVQQEDMQAAIKNYLHAALYK